MSMEDCFEFGSWPSEMEQYYSDYLEAEFEEDLDSIATETWIFNSVAAFMDDPRFALLYGDPELFETRSCDPSGNVFCTCTHVYHQLSYMGNLLGDVLVNIYEDFVSVEFNWDSEAVLTA